jgi:preprotein translocase subunit SecE
MSEATQHSPSRTLDGALAALAVIAIGAGLWVFYGLSSLAPAARIAAVIAGLVVALGLMAVTHWGREFIDFAKSARVELRKMVWPQMEDAQRLTLVVFIATAFMAIFFWLADFVFSHVTRFLLGTGG